MSSTISGFASVEISPASSLFEIAASTRRMILPERVFGMSGTIMIWRGGGMGPHSPVTKGFPRFRVFSLCLCPRCLRTYRVGGVPFFSFLSGGSAGRLGDLINQQTGGLDFLGPEPVPGNVDDVINSTQDAIVAVGCLQSAVAGHVRPVAPVATVPILTIPRVVLVDVAIWVLPDRLK